jgi:hypothetical protein
MTSFHLPLSFAFGLGPLFTVGKHVALLLAIETLLFFEELLAFLIC